MEEPTQSLEQIPTLVEQDQLQTQQEQQVQIPQEKSSPELTEKTEEEMSKDEAESKEEETTKEIVVQPYSLTSASAPAPAPVPKAEQPFNAEGARRLAAQLIHTYFTTQHTPLTRHHIESYDQFIQRDLTAIIQTQNPILVLKNPKSKSKSTEPLYVDPDTKKKYYYMYNTEIYIGGESGTEIFVGMPTITLDHGNDVRTLFPNEARLRNLTYAVQIEANILVRVTILQPRTKEDPNPVPIVTDISIPKFHLCNMPLMLHSRYCILHGKSKSLLQTMGECPKDQGGYFIIEGSEKVLVTRQEGAFNTLWITEQAAEPNIQYYANITSLNPKTREVKYVSFYWSREQVRAPAGFGKDKATEYRQSLLEVSIPYVMKPLPIFILFRALGIQSDKAILQLIFPDFQNPESKYLADLLIPSINAAHPFLDTYSAVQYIKSLTKLSGELGGVGEARVLDILHNHLFPHVEDLPFARVTFLADCVRKILRVVQKIDQPASRDDTRNQRLLTSGFLCQMLFQNIYGTYVKAVKLKVDETFNYNDTTYSGMNFLNIFGESNRRQIFASGHITQGLMRGFKGKWRMSSNKEESGLLQELDRLSYLNFMSHLRHVILNFDTGMKLQGPRRLNPSQYGYFCTSETPSGSSIGITKNLTLLTAISTGSYPDAILKWLFSRGSVLPCEFATPNLTTVMVPIYVNSGIIGYSGNPKQLVRVLRYMKRSGYLPPLCSVGFSIPERRIFMYIDDGRPLRPLIICDSRGVLPPLERFVPKSWRDLVVGLLRPDTSISSQEFIDPLEKESHANLDAYIAFFEKEKDKLAVIEYLDPYEQNEALIANWPEHVLLETTHMEVHPSTILGLLGNMIPFPNHNQSPRNQLSASQSKQGLSIYATNWKNRFDNTANILCYGQSPLCRTIYQDYIGDGQMSYGQNVILAMGMYGGYNQEDGIIMNADAMARGQFRSINYRSYETFEEDDKMSHTQTRIGNPKQVPGWLDVKVSNDYSKLDDSGIIKVGSYVTQTTVLVGKYLLGAGKMKDTSLTPQVWTRGRVESVVVTVNNVGLRLVKIRVTQDRVPELGDKFCLTPDHDVLTIHGWKPIYLVRKEDKVAQLNKESFKLEYVYPLEVVEFEHYDTVYEIITSKGTQMVTEDHRVFIKSKNLNETCTFIKASLLYTLQHDNYEVYDETMQLCPILEVKHYTTNPISSNVFCLSVPSQVFLVRRGEDLTGLWTGNSNRHGQKGTINVLYRGHDMPRTADGITPDMIMNPTAIPSRMTIGQILEMILGNVAVNVGAIGNCTAFMNDGSPHEALGNILEKEFGLHKLCNQVLYNGITGEQIVADIFMGVVYGMRLKHMTEDKWNARGAGRKEQRTHQPTGGRGNEGGLKIGEMERDAILGHGISGFIRESYMDRSDGTTFIVCNGCGTVPIYNEKQGLYICSMCDGPIQYSGDSASSLEPIPPPVRSAVTFSKVAMPYATNLFFQELNTFMNMGSRILTTHDVTKLKGMDKVEELAAVTIQDVDQILPEVVYPDTVVPALPEKPVLQTAAQVSAELGKLQDESVELYQSVLNVQPTGMEQVQVQEQQSQQPMVQMQLQEQGPQVQLQPSQTNLTGMNGIQVMPNSITGFNPVSNQVVTETDTSKPVFLIDTSAAALESSGLKQPGDATKSIAPPTQFQQDTLQQQQQQPQQSRRRVVRSQQQPGQQPGQQQEQRQAGAPQQPIIVEKLG